MFQVLLVLVSGKSMFSCEVLLHIYRVLVSGTSSTCISNIYYLYQVLLVRYSWIFVVGNFVCLVSDTVAIWYHAVPGIWYQVLIQGICPSHITLVADRDG